MNNRPLVWFSVALDFLGTLILNLKFWYIYFPKAFKANASSSGGKPRVKKIPKTQICKDKDKISPILPERDLPRPLSNAGSCSTNYSTAPTSPLKKEAVIFNTLSIINVHTSFQNSICCLLFSRTLHNKKYLHLS